jgi:signal transduction histidine kinase
MNISRPKARLLVVDDEAAQATALYNTLTDAGYEVLAFTSARQALDALRAQPYDVVLTDLKMPEMSGIEFLRSAQETDSNLVGVMMTGHAAIDTAIEAMKAGALDYVVKPFKLSTIQPVITRALEVRRLRLEVAELQRRVSQHVAELEAANRELETFSYSVSHDLRAPLRAISGFSNILVRTYAPQFSEEVRSLLTRIMTNAERMGELIEHLLRFSQLNRQTLLKQQVVVATLVNELVEELRRDNVPREVQVRIGNLPDTMGDPVLLRQVFYNLLANAFKFTRNKDVAEVEVGTELQEQMGLVYFVRDNGAGFDMNHAENLFRVFHRLHAAREFEGTGVGLSLVQRIVQRHGGQIWAKAAPQQGAAFYFTLPGA